MESSHISRIASEILLFIFLHLDLNQLVRSRRVSKQFQEVIDNNQLLWRVFEWIQLDQESFRPALDMFDQNSRSSLEKVSIQEQVSKQDFTYLMEVLHRSREILNEITLKTSGFGRVEAQIVELAAAGSSRLRSLVLWDWDSDVKSNDFPLAHLKLSKFEDQKSSSGQLQLLWLENGVGKLDSKHLNSLISFAQGIRTEPLECRELISNFSKTIVHLKLLITGQGSTIEPLFCPNLKIFEGWVSDGVSSFLDAPRLQLLVLEDVIRDDLEGVMPSVEEIWLRSRLGELNDSEDWEPLLRLCPKLRILKLTERFVETPSEDSYDLIGLLETLESRKEQVQDGKESDGINMVSFQKLILPTEHFSKEDLDRAAKVVEEVIDVKDYPEYIEIKY